MSQKIKTGGAQFNPADERIYFIASGMGPLKHAIGFNNNQLLAVNELHSDKAVADLRAAVDSGVRVLIDSGVFNLTNQHARKYGVSMDEALALPPDKIEGFDELLAKYLKIVSEIGKDAWGYIEIDQGGRENKIKTRARLEALGLRPIPVYHPFNDGVEYFDYLAERYDRICFGNLVQASMPERERLITTCFERSRKYPDLWIHLLGVTPCEFTHSCPTKSSDSSSWLSAIRWLAGSEFAVGKSVSRLEGDLSFSPNYEGSTHKAYGLYAWQAAAHGRNWADFCKDMNEVLQ